MTPTELRDDVPALERTAYMNTGASGPSPTRVVDAVESCLEHQEYRSPGAEGMYPAADDVFDEARAAVEDLLGADSGEVALTGSTTDGINRVADAVDWRAGDTVVRTDLEHSSGILPWRRLRDTHAVQVEVVPTEGGRVDRDAYAEAVADARLVCFSALTWTHGTTLPVSDLVDVAHDAGAQVLVDAVQVPGQRRFDVHEWGADFVASAGHKWLLGPWGAGFLYVADDATADLEPTRIGYRGVKEPDASGYEYRDGARGLEVGTASPAPYAGLVEAVETIEDVGYDAVDQRIERLTDRLKRGVGADRLVSPADSESGLVSFEVEDAEGFVERLREDDVVIRPLPRPDTVRASLHVFNTADDVDALLDAL